MQKRISGTWALYVIMGVLASQASAQAKESKSCGKATILSGQTCSDLKVEFDLKDCDFAAGAETPTPILKCDGDKLSARVQIIEDGTKHRLEALFNKKSDGWGATTWASQGSVRYKVVKAEPKKEAKAESASAVAVVPVAVPVVAPVSAPSVAPAPAPVKPEAKVETKSEPVKEAKVETAAPAEDRAPAAANVGSKSPELAPAAAPEAPSVTTIPGTFKFGGFFDFRYTAINASESRTYVNPHGESGFGLEDGAIYVNYEHDRLSAMVDVSVRRGVDKDTNSANAYQSNTANWILGADKSQAFLRYKIVEGFVAQVGQFDTIFGVEFNDSKDRVFGKTGLVYDQTLPVVHSGAMLEYSNSGAYVKAFAANPNNKGSNGTSSTGDDKSEYGLAFGYSNDVVRGQLGGMVRSIAKADRTAMANRVLADATLGTTVGNFALDLEFNVIDDPSKNTLTGAADDKEALGSGFLALATYKISPPLLFGLRFEQTKDDPGQLSLKKATTIGGSVHYKMTQELELRTEFTSYQYENTSSVTWRDSRFAIGSLLSF